MQESFGLREGAAILGKEKKLIAVIIFTLTVLGVIVGMVVPPVYQAKTDLLVNFNNIEQNSNEINANEIETNLRLIETYKYIIGSSRILEQVAEELGDSVSSADIKKKIAVKTDENTQIITIIAEGRNPEEAMKLADSTAGFFKADIMKLMQLNNVHILAEANVDGSDTLMEKRVAVYAFISFCLSIVVAALAIIWKENILNRLDSMAKIDQNFTVPALGLVPFAKAKKSKIRRKRAEQITWMIDESYSTIRTHLKYLMKEKNTKVIMFTSANAGDGKSIVTSNIAISMAKQNMKTLYIDLDLRKGTGREVFAVPQREGVSHYLSGKCSAEDIIFPTQVPNLSFLGTGPYPSDPAELLAGERLGELIEHLKKSFDIILIDSPPLMIADPLIISGHVDGCVIVADARKTKITQMAENIQKLRKVKADVWGIVLNKAKTGNSNLYY